MEGHLEKTDNGDKKMSINITPNHPVKNETVRDLNNYQDGGLQIVEDPRIQKTFQNFNQNSSGGLDMLSSSRQTSTDPQVSTMILQQTKTEKNNDQVTTTSHPSQSWKQAESTAKQVEYQIFSQRGEQNPKQAIFDNKYDMLDSNIVKNCDSGRQSLNEDSVISNRHMLQTEPGNANIVLQNGGQPRSLLVLQQKSLKGASLGSISVTGPSQEQLVAMNDLSDVLDVRLSQERHDEQSSNNGAFITFLNDQQQDNVFSRVKNGVGGENIRLQDLFNKNENQRCQTSSSDMQFMKKRVKSQQKTRRKAQDKNIISAMNYLPINTTNQRQQWRVVTSNINHNQNLPNSQTLSATATNRKNRASFKFGHNTASLQQKNRQISTKLDKGMMNGSYGQGQGISFGNKDQFQSLNRNVIDLNMQLDINQHPRAPVFHLKRNSSSPSHFLKAAKNHHSQIKLKVELDSNQQQQLILEQQQSAVVTYGQKNINKQLVRNVKKVQERIDNKNYMRQQSQDYGQNNKHTYSRSTSINQEHLQSNKLQSQGTLVGDLDVNSSIEHQPKANGKVQQSSDQKISTQEWKEQNPRPSLVEKQARQSEFSSFQTMGMHTSHIKESKHIHQNSLHKKDHLSEDSLKVSEELLQDGEQEGKEESNQLQISKKPDFVIKSFQNSVTSKAQRLARRSSLSNPYNNTNIQRATTAFGGDAGSRSTKLNIVVNTFEKKKAQEKFLAQNEDIGDYSSTDIKNTHIMPNSMTPSRTNTSLESPLIMRKKGLLKVESQQTDTEKRKQKRNGKTSSIGTNEGHDGGIYDAFPTVPEENDTLRQLAKGSDIIKTNITIQQKEKLDNMKGISFGSVDQVDTRYLTQEDHEDTQNTNYESSLLLKRPERKLAEKVLKERQAIFKRNAQVKRKLQDTQVLVDQKEQYNQSQNFSVQKVRLQPKGKETVMRKEIGNGSIFIQHSAKFSNIESSASNNLIVFNTHEIINDNTNNENASNCSLNRLQLSQQTSAFMERKNLKTTVIRRGHSQNQMKMRKRIEAAKKFNQEYNEPISSIKKNKKQTKIASINGGVIMGLSIQNSQKMVVKSIHKSQSMEETIKLPGDQSTDKITEDSRKILNNSKTFQKEKFDQLSPVHSSQLLSTSRQESQMLNNKSQYDCQSRASHEIIYTRSPDHDEFYHKNSFGVRKESKKSMAYMRPKIIKQPASLKKRENQTAEYLSGQPSFREPHHQGTCKCVPEEKTNASLEQQQNGLQNEIMDPQNPYKLTEVERQRLKDQNHILISQFQQVPNELCQEDDELNAAVGSFAGVAGGKWRRSSLDTQGTLYLSMQKKKQFSTKQIVIMAKKNQKEEGSEERQKQEKNNLSSIDQKSSKGIMNDDLKILLKESGNFDRQNDSDPLSNEDDLDASPIYRPVKKGDVQKNDRVEIAAEQIIGSSLPKHESFPGSTYGNNQIKDRPISSKENNNSITISAKNTSKNSNKSTKRNFIKSKTKGSNHRLSSIDVNTNPKQQQQLQQQTMKIDATNESFSNNYKNDNLQIKERQSNSVDMILAVSNKSTSRIPTQEERFVSTVPDEQQSKDVDHVYDPTQQTQEGKDEKNSKKSSVKHFSVEVQADFYPEQVVQGLSAERILSMTESEITDLNFKQVCIAQHVLYATLNQLQTELFQAFINRSTAESQTKSKSVAPTFGNNSNQHQQQRNVSPHLLIYSQRGIVAQAAPELPGVEHHIVKTNYQNATSSKKSLDKYSNLGNNLALYNQMMPKANQRQKSVKIKFVEEANQIKKDQVMIERENYQKYKMKQERMKRRREKIAQSAHMLNQCSIDELFLMSKINFLRNQQNLLVSKAKQISIAEMRKMGREGYDFREIKEQSIAIEQMEEQKANCEKFSVSGLIDNSHTPSVHKLSSRQQIYKQTRTGDIQNNKSSTLINQAHEKLQAINRRSILKPNQMIQMENSRSKLGFSLHSKDRSGSLKGTQSDEALVTSHNWNQKMNPRIHSSINDQKLAAQNSFGDNSSGLKNILANHKQFQADQPQSMASTINLYLKKFNNAEKFMSPINGQREPSTIAVSPDRLNLQLVSNYNNSAISGNYDVKKTEFVVGQRSVTNKSSVDIDTLRKLPLRERTSSMQNKDENDIKTQEIQLQKDQNDQAAAESSSVSADVFESPVEKYNLIYKTQEVSSFNQKNVKHQKKHMIMSNSMNKLKRNSSKSSSKKSNNTQHRRASKSNNSVEGFARINADD